MIKLSASLIKDFLVCPGKAYYRVYQPEQAEQTNAMTVGTIVHEIIETCWMDRDKAINKIDEKINEYNIYTGADKIYKCINNFFEMFSGVLTEEDIIEQYFKIPYKDDVFLTGRIDRIHNTVIFDWKTSSSEPDDITKDIQFILYDLAYKKLYGKPPGAVVYVSLMKKKLHHYEPNPIIVSEFENHIIPHVIESIREKKFTRTGLFGYKSCLFCSFSNACHTDLGLE